jgi:hypothetical protein
MPGEPLPTRHERASAASGAVHRGRPSGRVQTPPARPLAARATGRCDCRRLAELSCAVVVGTDARSGGRSRMACCKDLEGRHGTLVMASRSYFLFCSAFFSSVATSAQSCSHAARSPAGRFASADLSRMPDRSLSCGQWVRAARA